MRIKKAEIAILNIPLKSVFRTAFGELHSREIVFLTLYDKSGLKGVGESANLALPVYEPEFNEASVLLLKKVLIPQILNKEIKTIQELENQFAHIRGNNFAKVAVEAAFWHIKSQQTNLPLRTLWGGKKEIIPAAISIGLGTDLEQSIQKITDYISEFMPKRVKIKIKPGIDVKLVAVIRNRFPNLPIMVDANAGYSIKDIKIFRTLDKLDLLMIEQPFSYNDIVEHACLQKIIKTPICLDESINNYHMAKQAIAIKACKIINIKPQRVGGYWQAKLISELAQKEHIPVWCGGMIEAGWGQLFNCHIATLANFIYENDICLTKWYLADDILERPIVENKGTINVKDTDKLFVINTKKFMKYKVKKITVI